MAKSQIAKEEIMERVLKCIEALLKMSHKDLLDSDFKMSGETDIADDFGLDSIEIMDLIGLLEAEFKLKVKAEEAVGKRKIKDIVEFVQKQIS